MNEQKFLEYLKITQADEMMGKLQYTGSMVPGFNL